MSYSEQQLRDLSWDELAATLDMTPIQRQLLGQVVLMERQGNQLAGWHARRLKRQGKEFVFWLSEAREADTFANDPNPGLMLANARDECDKIISQLHQFLMWQPGTPYSVVS